MKLKKPNKPFKYISTFENGSKSNHESFKNSFNRKNSLSKSSLAPNTVIIQKYKRFLNPYFYVLIFILYSQFIYETSFSFYSIYYIGFSALIFTLLIVHALNNGIFRNKKSFIKISKQGIMITEKRKTISVDWSKIIRTEIKIGNDDEPPILQIVAVHTTHKIILSGASLNFRELRYLLDVFKARHTNKPMLLIMEFENKYFELNKKNRDMYILKKENPNIFF